MMLFEHTSPDAPTTGTFQEVFDSIFQDMPSFRKIVGRLRFMAEARLKLLVLGTLDCIYDVACLKASDRYLIV